MEKPYDDEELEIQFILAQRAQAERKGHRSCVKRCDLKIKTMLNEMSKKTERRPAP